MRYGTIDTDYAAVLAGTPIEADGPIWMVNFMRYRPVADYADGRESTISGREADDLYAPLDVLAAIGADVAFAGDVVGNADQDGWDRIAIVRYPTRRSFIDMQSRPDFVARHIHKDAGMDFTIVMGAVPEAGGAAPVHGGAVQLVAHPPARNPLPLGGGTRRFRVEGVIVGDERRFGALDMTWSSNGSAPAAAPGAVEALTQPMLDRVSELFQIP